MEIEATAHTHTHTRISVAAAFSNPRDESGLFLAYYASSHAPLLGSFCFISLGPVKFLPQLSIFVVELWGQVILQTKLLASEYLATRLFNPAPLAPAAGGTDMWTLD